MNTKRTEKVIFEEVRNKKKNESFNINYNVLVPYKTACVNN